MKKLSLLFALLVLASCGVKQTQNLLSSGNYDEAINNSISNLRSNKDKKGNQDYVYLLEEAFAKAKERDLNAINLWEKEKNPANFEKIYNTYLQINNRQEKIKPLLPLKLLKEGRNAIFPFDNYNDEIVASKNNLSGYLYANAKALLSSSNKMNFRKSFDDLTYLNEINPNYKNVLNLMDEAHFKGTDYVFVYAKNETDKKHQQHIPAINRRTRCLDDHGCQDHALCVDQSVAQEEPHIVPNIARVCVDRYRTLLPPSITMFRPFR